MTSALNNALTRIFKWIEQHKPWYIEYLQPGLSIAEIEDLVKVLPLQLPTEVYELYQWRNGATKGDMCIETAWIFENWTFRPLQEAVARYQRSNHPNFLFKLHHNVPHVSSFDTFRIFYNKGACEEGFIWINTNLEFCPVIFEDFKGGGSYILQKYTSLTDMMLTMAECYETGTYYHDPEAYDRWFISSNYNKQRQIWRTYNSKIVEFALHILQTRSVDVELLIYISDELIEFKELEAVEPLIQVIEKSIYQGSDRLTNTYTKMEASIILGKLGDVRAVPALIALLKDNYYYRMRVYAAKALGQLRDERATFPLIHAFQERESEVRRAVVWALGEIKDPRAAELVIEALQDSDKEVRQIAREALAKLVSESPEIDEIIPL